MPGRRRRRRRRRGRGGGGGSRGGAGQVWTVYEVASLEVDVFM